MSRLISKPGAPSVSVVLPTYNRASLLARAIDSVLAQTHRDFELIVVDDASTDHTSEVLAGYDDPRVVRVRRRRNSGPCGARNSGIRKARGRYVAFQDSDDEWYPDKLEKQLQALVMGADSRAPVACYCRMLQRLGERQRIRPDGDKESLGGEIYRRLLRGSTIGTPTLVVGHETLLAVGGFDERLRRFEDWDLALRLARQGPIRFLPEVLMTAWATPESVNARADHQCTVQIISKYLDAYRSEPGLSRRAASWLWYAGARLAMQGKAGEGRKAWELSLSLAPHPARQAVAWFAHPAPRIAGTMAVVWAKRFSHPSGLLP